MKQARHGARLKCLRDAILPIQRSICATPTRSCVLRCNPVRQTERLSVCIMYWTAPKSDPPLLASYRLIMHRTEDPEQRNPTQSTKPNEGERSRAKDDETWNQRYKTTLTRNREKDKTFRAHSRLQTLATKAEVALPPNDYFLRTTPPSSQNGNEFRHKGLHKRQ